MLLLIIDCHIIPNNIINHYDLNYNRSCNHITTTHLRHCIPAGCTTTHLRHCISAGCHIDYTPDFANCNFNHHNIVVDCHIDYIIHSASFSRSLHNTAINHPLDSTIVDPNCHTITDHSNYIDILVYLNHSILHD